MRRLQKIDATFTLPSNMKRYGEKYFIVFIYDCGAVNDHPKARS